VHPVSTTLGQRLGHPADARLVIVNCDDLGTCHAANSGIYEALRDGIATSATLMLPAPWAREAAARYRGEDVGVHLTLNSEWDLYRWAPVTHAPSLVDGDGGFPRTVQEVWDHGDLDEVRRELRMQVERAVLWGFDVTHLDSHMAVLHQRPEFFDVYLDLAVDFGLPIRLPGAETERAIGFPFRRLAAEEGVVSPDQVVALGNTNTPAMFERALHNLEPGVTEIVAHPALDTPELRAMAPDWMHRVEDRRLLVDDDTVRRLAERAGVTFLGYRELRELQRGA
jgi:predicted glycoside hydrolase/deacetylase ChbG (UPF0249 family)